MSKISNPASKVGNTACQQSNQAQSKTGPLVSCFNIKLPCSASYNDTEEAHEEARRRFEVGEFELGANLKAEIVSWGGRARRESLPVILKLSGRKFGTVL